MTRYVLGFKVAGIDFGWREQQVRAGVDCGSKFFLRPGQSGIEAPEPRFDMSERHRAREGGQCAAKGAGGIPLDHQQAWRVGKQRSYCLRNFPGMGVRIALPRAIEHFPLILLKLEIGRP